MEQPAYFELNFRPNVALVSVVRRFVSEFYERFLSDPDTTSRVALATHELLENAVKYSKDGETTIRIEVERERAPRRVTIALRNSAEPADIAAIREILDGVRRADNAFDYYQTLLAARAKTREAGGLGLARIAAEGEMAVSYRVEGNTVVIEAVTEIGGA
jgi:anti-sigma regulatory factor (Ser/Thr protein kinase)